MPKETPKTPKGLARLLGTTSAAELVELARHVDRYYRPVKLPTCKGDGSRSIHAPTRSLKLVQKSILSKILDVPLASFVHGGTTGKSIISNARAHQQHEWVACLDIRKFFPSTHYTKVRMVFTNLGWPDRLARLLTQLTTLDYGLPQGAPTSPVLANLVLADFDRRVQRLCGIKHLTYSRYFDDVTISGNRRLEASCKTVMGIARSCGFRIHRSPEKFRICNRTQPQVVCGLVVNGKTLRLSEEHFERIRGRLECLRQQRLPSGNLGAFRDSVTGVIAFLETVDQQKADVIREQFDSIRWSIYGLDDTPRTRS